MSDQATSWGRDYVISYHSVERKACTDQCGADINKLIALLEFRPADFPIGGPALYHLHSLPFFRHLKRSRKIRGKKSGGRTRNLPVGSCALYIRPMYGKSGEGTLTAFNIRRKRMELQSELFDSEMLCLATMKQGQKLICGTGEGTLNFFNWGEWGNISDRFPCGEAQINCIMPVTEYVAAIGTDDGFIRNLPVCPPAPVKRRAKRNPCYRPNLQEEPDMACARCLHYDDQNLSHRPVTEALAPKKKSPQRKLAGNLPAPDAPRKPRGESAFRVRELARDNMAPRRLDFDSSDSEEDDDDSGYGGRPWFLVGQ
ncbi:hypothetical protein EGW08_001367 [Elysia chlorotica]|uniref:Uncharacterized protein n=1 Tax=Elysia chlorotica TaxID=188477 RepID=A0A3S1BTD5_ELYCH|nr:hypothetical protein EGW08_001367 [Elysia chlorotica]